MPAYLVKLPTTNSAGSLLNGARNVTVFAESPADAIAMAQSQFAADSDGLWAAALTTAALAAADMTGFTLRCIISDPVTGVVSVDVSQVGVNADVMDDLGTDIVVALNATASIDAASYNATTNLLTVAAISDALGDQNLAVTFTPPVATSEVAITIPSFVGAIVDEGIAAAVLTVQLATDAIEIPKIAV